MTASRLLAPMLAAGLLLGAADEARALCIYRGVDYARTTLEQEFEDSRWVARVRVRAAETRLVDEGDSWTVYRLEVLEGFKGDPPRVLNMFTTRDSGGFYMDRGSEPDLDRDYLLFLNPIRDREQAAGMVMVNYSCGKSGLWSEIPAADRATLERLARASS